MTVQRRPEGGQEEPGWSQDGWIKLVALLVIAVVAVVAMVITSSPAAAGVAVTPLLGGFAVWFGRGET